VDVGRYPNLPEWEEGDDERDKAAQAADAPSSSPVEAKETKEDRAKAEKERKENERWAKLSTVEKSTATHSSPGRSHDTKWDTALKKVHIGTEEEKKEKKEEDERIVSPGGDEVRHGAPLDQGLRNSMHASQSKNTVARTEWNKHAVKPKPEEEKEEILHEGLLKPGPSTSHTITSSGVPPIKAPIMPKKKSPFALTLNTRPPGHGLHRRADGEMRLLSAA
jgi:hypothetical protein